MSGGNYNSRPNSRGSGYGYRGGQREYDYTNQQQQPPMPGGYRGGSYRGYQPSSQQQQQQQGAYHYPPQQPQQGYDDYNYDYRYSGYRGGRGRGRGGSSSGGYYSNSRVPSNGGVQPYGYQSNNHPYTPPVVKQEEPVQRPVEVVKKPVEVEKPVDLSEKHWIERIHIEGDDQKALSALFDELDKVNSKLDQATIRRMDVEVEVLKLDRFSKMGEERCKMAEDQLESMNLGLL